MGKGRACEWLLNSPHGHAWRPGAYLWQSIPRCWLCPTQRQGAAQNPVRHSFGIALIEKFILTLAQAVKESLAVDRLHSTALNVNLHDCQFRDVDWFCQSNCREKERPPVCLGRRLFFQPTTQPTECDVLYDLRVVWQSPRVL